MSAVIFAIFYRDFLLSLNIIYATGSTDYFVKHLIEIITRYPGTGSTHSMDHENGTILNMISSLSKRMFKWYHIHQTISVVLTITCCQLTFIIIIYSTYSSVSQKPPKNVPSLTGYSFNIHPQFLYFGIWHQQTFKNQLSQLPCFYLLYNALN